MWMKSGKHKNPFRTMQHIFPYFMSNSFLMRVQMREKGVFLPQASR